MFVAKKSEPLLCVEFLDEIKKQFDVPVIGAIHQILSDYKTPDARSLFDLYVLTGGMPKYLDLFVENGALSFKTMLDFMLDANSPFLQEGKNLLIEEFGKDYGTYFSILELIASGKTARSEIESLLESNIGGYLDRLEKDYAIYCGRILEGFFHDLIADTGKYNQIGSYWERGNENEIDIVAVNDLKKEIMLAEVKLNKSRINITALKKKAGNLLQAYQGYKPVWLGLSLEDARDYLHELTTTMD